MSESDSNPPPEAPKDLKDKDLRPREKTSGRVAFDSRGNAVWEWKMKTGVFGRDVDTGKLKSLEAKELKIAADVEAPPTEEQKREATRAARRSTGFDPYNSTAPRKRPAAPPRPGVPPEEKPARRGFFRRLFGRD